MALSVNTNIASLNAMAAASSINKEMETAMNRLSTGKRINTAADDAAGVAISSRLTSEIKGTSQAIRNAGDAQSLIDTAEGAHQEVENILQRMRELSVQAASDTNSTSDRANLQVEMDQLATEINRIALSTTWAGTQLLNGSSGTSLATSTSDSKTLSFQVGASSSTDNTLTMNVKAISTQALGISGDDGSSPSFTNLDVTTSSATSSIGLIEADGDTISLIGPWTDADSYTVDINDQTVTITLSATDDYTDDAAGFSAQLKDVILADATLSQYITVTDNEDGSVSLSQPEVPLIDNTSVASGAAGSIENEGISVSGGTITFSGDVEQGDTWNFNVNGVSVAVTVSDIDGFEDSLVGLGALAKSTIEGTTGLTGLVTVTDNGDGSVTLSQSSEPWIDEVTKAAGTTADPSVVYSSATGTFTFTNAIYEDGSTYSAEINGTEVSITTSDEDGFDDNVTGIAAQFTQAINAAGIDGMSATYAAGVVTLVPEITVADALITSDNGIAETSIVSTAGDQTTATLTITSTDNLMEVGDTVSFSVQGTDFEITVGDDGFDNTMAGVAAQMKSVVDAAGLTGVTVVASSTTTGQAAVHNLDFDFDDAAASGEVLTLVVDGNTLTYTTTAEYESFDTILAGLQTSLAADATAAAAFSLSTGADGTSIDITFLAVGAQNTASTLTFGTKTDAAGAAQVNTSEMTTTGVDAGAANTAVLTITGTPVVANVGTGGDGMTLELADGALTLGGTVNSGDEISFDLGGTSISLTAYSSSLSDMASMMVDAINTESGGSIVASLNDDGTISVSNSSGSASVMSSAAALAAIDNIDAAIETLNTQRANLGAISNRIDSTISNLTNIGTNLEAGRGRIEDADFAAESAAMAKAQILQQASTAMLAQANASKQGVLQLLKG